MNKVQDIRFHQAAEHESIIALWEQMFDHAKTGLQAAVCYATAPGIAVLSKAARSLNYGNGFFVASVEYPTNIDALHDLHRLIPGRVHIHLGYETPRTNDEVKQDGYALMHSKLMLALGYQGCRLWVGSHNLTARAMSGANLEAGVMIDADHDMPVIQDATRHLLACRDSAEVFDPERIDIYKAIQRRRKGPGIDVESKTILVIHAEAQEVFLGMQPPFNVHLRLKPHELDNYFAMDREVRLFLYPMETLRPGQVADRSKAVGWKGSQTGIVRTELHPRNRGVQGRFDKAQFQVFVKDRDTPPVAAPMGMELDGVTTQVTMSFIQSAVLGAETYSVRTGTAGIHMKTTEESRNTEVVDARLVSSFRQGSIQDGVLHFERITGVEAEVKVQSYAATLQPLKLLGESDVAFSYVSVEPKHPLDPYFFVTKSVVRVGG